MSVLAIKDCIESHVHYQIKITIPTYATNNTQTKDDEVNVFAEHIT